jgi:DNA-binding beta-propeller fold protein YncE
MVAGVEVGPTPEHVALSPDGRYLAAVIGNGSAFTRTATNFAEVTGRLKVLRVDGARLVAVAEAPIGHNCQGAAFSDDGRTIVVQCAVEKTISSFRFDGKALTPVSEVLTFDARPGAIATRKSR